MLFQCFQLKIRTPVFWERFSFSRKSVSKLKYLKIFKISTDHHIKTCRSLRQKAVLKISSTVFKKELCSFCWLWNQTSKKKCFPVLRQIPAQISQWNLLKRAIINLYCLLDESHFSNICTVYYLILECIEFSWHLYWTEWNTVFPYEYR